MEDLMKVIYAITTTVSLIFFMITSAQAGNAQISGLLIGGGTGALVGQALGRNTEATIAGATVGGILGLAIGGEVERQHGSLQHPSVTLAHSSRGYHQSYRPLYRDHYRTAPRYNRHFRECRKVITFKRTYYGSKRVVSLICDNGFRRFDDRHRHFRYDHRF